MDNNSYKVEVRDLCFQYENRPLLDHISLHAARGEFVTLLGASGCGKSTILNLLAGILRPDSGDLFVDGQRIAGMSGHFSYMPQNDLLFSWKTILENVCLYGRIHGGIKQAREKAKSLFPAFGLEGYENAYPNELSGGMRQRAAFLRTALCGADILLLDEPFGALDVISRGSMQDWLSSMKLSLNRTVLLVTHDVDEAIYLSDRIYVLGGKPTGIVNETGIPEKNRTRGWLFDQVNMRKALYASIRGEGPEI